MGNYVQHKSKIQHGGVTGKGTAENAILNSTIQQSTSVNQQREVIEVENSSHFFFRVKDIDNTIRKENQ